ncbi:MAG: hypothetical protein U0Q47_09050 [Mycobacterium sp.]
MGVGALIIITLCCIAWSLWIRHVTWTCRWEVAATLNIALQGAAVFLMSPFASETIGQVLHGLTGKWNLEDYIGHDCYVVAASAIVYNALGRLQEDKAMQEAFKQYVERPATLCIPLLLATFSVGNGAAVYRSDFFQVPTDFWLSTYWLLLCGTLIYLLVYGSRALLILRRDPRSRRIANVYLLASASGVVACSIRIITAYVPALQEVERGMLVWFFACTCGAGFALASAHSWRIKTKWFTHASH